MSCDVIESLFLFWHAHWIILSKYIIMENTKNVNNLEELLDQYQNLNNPALVCLSCREGSNNYLMDQVVAKIQEEGVESISYSKLDTDTSNSIKEELMVTKDPILLLIQKGEIKAIFSGLVGRFQLEDALQNLKSI